MKKKGVLKIHTEAPLVEYSQNSTVKIAEELSSPWERQFGNPRCSTNREGHSKNKNIGIRLNLYMASASNLLNLHCSAIRFLHLTQIWTQSYLDVFLSHERTWVTWRTFSGAEREKNTHYLTSQTKHLWNTKYHFRGSWSTGQFTDNIFRCEMLKTLDRQSFISWSSNSGSIDKITAAGDRGSELKFTGSDFSSA